MKKSKRNGFTLIDSLLSLLIVAIVSLLCIMMLDVTKKILIFDSSHQNQYAILQLRQKCAISSDVYVDEGRLHLIENHKEIYLEYDNHRLVQRDGYVIWMEHIEDAYFYEIDHQIYLRWIYDEKEYNSQIS
ncbi:competence type IV pilus minor pilin ComGF [Floccifex sp.]|uniref:competence type IV pilus minor pilin ComGF n=1 Tax=Floccifex sp. TaxID=2815810 RepID=UPI002A750C1E|nr:competence type IV pilus minor pilin ComGF [Floccifex sp.]MDD7281379.1 competence type IV pilus minor pilin ComGF [Erysipelotrichaceae bacterium]MDY2958084.1 competence type IV pilus minor pilin ComGF [Floccifex sp.]